MQGGKLSRQAVVRIDPAHTASRARVADMDVGKTAFRKQPGKLRKRTGAVDENTVRDSFPDQAAEIRLRVACFRKIRQHQRVALLSQRMADAAEDVEHMRVTVCFLFFQAG